MHAKESNPNPKVYSFKQDIFKLSIETQLYLEVPQFIMKKHLESAIGALRGTDKRNYKQWINDLEKYGMYQKNSI
jgi:hypothetical protein